MTPITQYQFYQASTPFQLTLVRLSLCSLFTTRQHMKIESLKSKYTSLKKVFFRFGKAFTCQVFCNVDKGDRTSWIWNRKLDPPDQHLQTSQFSPRNQSPTKHKKSFLITRKSKVFTGGNWCRFWRLFPGETSFETWPVFAQIARTMADLACARSRDVTPPRDHLRWLSIFGETRSGQGSRAKMPAYKAYTL